MRTRFPVSPRSLAAALLAGLALRLFFVFHFPFAAGDTKFYDELARNWLDHHVYGLFVGGRLVPSDMRAPGYPAFLAAVYSIFGRPPGYVFMAQAIVDLGTCLLAALIAARLAPSPERRAVATGALWIAALCPFTANYAAVFLTEALATFCTACALLILVCALDHAFLTDCDDGHARHDLLSFIGWIWLAGVSVGLGALVRPEAPLALMAAGVIFAIRLRRRTNWRKLVLTASWMTVGLVLPLAPWAARNARTIGRIEFLAPRYAETRGDFIPRGFFAWTRTWMVRYGDAYRVPWRLGKGTIATDALPASAFDSVTERARVEALLARYNTDLEMTPVLDRGFALLAQQRTSRNPLRTHLVIPAERALTMWLTPRVGFLRYSGQIVPIGERWRDNRADFATTVLFALLNLVYLGLALIGAWVCRGRPELHLLAAFILVRTAFLTELQTVEPRYVIECFPALLATGGQAFPLLRRWTCSAAAEPISSDTLRCVYFR